MLTWGLTLREIQSRPVKAQEHQWMTEFLAALSREDVSPVTVRGYRSDLGQFVTWCDILPLERLTANDLSRFQQYLSQERLMKPASINRKLEVLRRFCRWAYRSGKLRTDVADQLKLIRTSRDTRPKGLTVGEVQALLRAAGQSRGVLAQRNYAILQLLLQVGLRVSEAAALRVEDLDIRERQGRIRIRSKRNKEERTLSLPVAVRRALQAYLDKREEAGAQEPVFLSETGGALSVRSIQSLITELARRSHLKRIPVSAHTLRHTFALEYLRQNPGKLVELSTLLGHELLGTTAVYALPSEGAGA